MGFGDFASICEKAALPVCYLLGSPTDFTSDASPVLLPACSARSIELGNTIIFQAATDFAHIAALAMTAIMIFHVRSKFTAVGRREILTFFYIYSVLTIISLVLDAGVIPATSSGAFPWFVAAQNGLTSALCTSLVINGFVGFQLYEDGTTLSVWLLRLTSLVMFIITFAVSLLTFKSWAGLSPTNTVGLFIVLYVINAIFLAVYFVMQVVLVVNTLQDRWPLGDLGFGAFFFVVGQVILYVFARKICEGVSHYLDGLFFATVLNLLAVMMVYKVCVCASMSCWRGTNSFPPSIGTVSPKRTLSSVSAPSKDIGMSRNHSWNPTMITELVSMEVAAGRVYMITAAWITLRLRQCHIIRRPHGTIIPARLRCPPKSNPVDL